MIISKEPISMAEAVEYLSEKEGVGKEVKEFIKKFVTLTSEDARGLKKKLEELDLVKLRDEQRIKIIDLVPESAEELNKICINAGLNEDETKKILDTIKEFI
jgi:DNA-directed RNA polymerase subunit F